MGGILSNLSSEDHSCPPPSLAENASQPFVGNLSFYQFNMILSGSCTAFACISTFSLMFIHATHLSKPNEQIKIMRIASLVPLYAIFSFLSICFPIIFVYLSPWATFFQAVALGNFFLLLCEFISPNLVERDAFFAALQVPRRWTGNTRALGLKWFWMKWIYIFQYPVVTFIAAVITDITQARNVYCLYSSKPYFAHIWLSIFPIASVVIAVTAILMFYRALRTQLAGHRPLSKLFAFKIMVFLTFVQGIAFLVLRDISSLNATSTFTFADLNIGISTMLVCIEMVPISVFFHYAYSVQPYIIRRSTTATDGPKVGESDEIQQQCYHGGILGINAWVTMCNPMEMVRAIGNCFKIAFQMRQKPVGSQL